MVPSPRPKTPPRVWPVLALTQGAAVLAVELAGGRLLVPLFGQSLALWSILITVTLGGLAAGYGVGARLARGPVRPSALALSFIVAGACALGVGWWGATVLGSLSVRPDTPRMVACAAVAVLPCLCALGAAAPLLVELAADGQPAGASAGRVFACSTVGSLVAGPLAGLYLLPVWGVRNVYLAVGFTLMGAGLLLTKRRGRPRIMSILICCTSVAYTLFLYTKDHDDRSPLLARYRSALGDVVVLEVQAAGVGTAGRNTRRVLLVDGHVQNAVDPSTDRGPPNSYQDAIHHLAGMRPEDRAVVLGLGAGLLPMTWARAGVHVVAAEPNAAVRRAAREHFGLDPAVVDVRPVDGRRLVRDLPLPAHVIVVDAFIGATVPAHLLTREAQAEAAARLAPGGLWLAWVLDFPDLEAGAVWPRVARTAREVFASVRVYRQDAPGELGGYLVAARDGPAPFEHSPPGFGLVPRDTVARATARCRVQTDDRSDVDRYGGRLNALAHLQVRRHVSADLSGLFLD